MVSIGRSFDEYLKIFDLNEENLIDKKILDIAGGFSSFTAEANLKEIDTKAIDKIYFFDDTKVKEIAKDGITKIKALIDQAEHNFEYFKNFQELLEKRKIVANLFLFDFANNKERYIGSNLPNINFKPHSFDLALISHLLFLYDDSFDLGFHEKTIQNALRVAKEVRIFPLVDSKCQKSKYLDEILESFKDFNCEIQKVDYEFLKNANEVLIIK